MLGSQEQIEVKGRNQDRDGREPALLGAAVGFLGSGTSRWKENGFWARWARVSVLVLPRGSCVILGESLNHPETASSSPRMVYYLPYRVITRV